MLTQIPQPIPRQIACRPRYKHLTAMRDIADPSGLMHIQADIVAVHYQRLAGMDAYPHTHRPHGKRGLNLASSREGVRGACKRDRECVARGPEFPAAARADDLADPLAVTAQLLAVALCAESSQQFRRAL